MDVGYWIVLREGGRVIAGPFPSQEEANEEMQDPLIGEDAEGETLVVTPDYYFQWGEPEIRYGKANWDTGLLEDA